MVTGNTTMSTNAIKQRKNHCKNCGGDQAHAQRREACPAYKSKCHGCGRIGHWKDFCLTTNNRQQGFQDWGRSRKHKRQITIESSIKIQSRTGTPKQIIKHARRIHKRAKWWAGSMAWGRLWHSKHTQCTTEENRTKAFATMRIYPDNNNNAQQRYHSKFIFLTKGFLFFFRRRECYNIYVWISVCTISMVTLAIISLFGCWCNKYGRITHPLLFMLLPFS